MIEKILLTMIVVVTGYAPPLLLVFFLTWTWRRWRIINAGNFVIATVPVVLYSIIFISLLRTVGKSLPDLFWSSLLMGVASAACILSRKGDAPSLARLCIELAIVAALVSLFVAFVPDIDTR